MSSVCHKTFLPAFCPKPHQEPVHCTAEMAAKNPGACWLKRAFCGKADDPHAVGSQPGQKGATEDALKRNINDKHENGKYTVTVEGPGPATLRKKKTSHPFLSLCNFYGEVIRSWHKLPVNYLRLSLKSGYGSSPRAPAHFVGKPWFP